ncbi:MAG: hypothetical protein BIP78_0295 [Candidatus Bipolaricaulis sibiricus]|uniref:Cardiolipin synthase N-terminal domain-containing protein n=1 Tax=Bipolaricaulis sibiricus TaxID=2501609 RepID=A0A410FSW6_BIPS1|nr:MAG: hypothetical protein BIP78_0295 [Candidatus Bipolaricaulis sibiricus]
MGNTAWADLPTWALVAVVVLGGVQLSLQVSALVILFRTPDERLVTGRRWVWVAVVVFGQLVGAIAFLAAGRRPVTEQDPLHSAPQPGDVTRAQARRAADLLYGDSSRAGRHGKER